MKILLIGSGGRVLNVITVGKNLEETISKKI
jgi:phosphoribosylamine-glycine ligase